ncbi:MAG: argininosuccinate lyase [Leptospiraceae bacterium]|nr:argininosuccinate lyase [Leptospiraceae bacterium]
MLGLRSDMAQKKLWHGRFSEAASRTSEEISESISFDYVLYQADIRASLAHARMLAQCGILTPSELEAIEQGLKQIAQEITEGKLSFSAQLEDIHTHIELRLTELIGDAGKKLHTARSRNDQVAVDTHLYVREALLEHRSDLLALLETFIGLAQKHQETLWIGYTHLQIAQPVLLAHYLLAYFWQFWRDLEFLDFTLNSLRFCPLGAAALGGPNYAIDRQRTAKDLGFQAPYPNSIDAVANRDYQLNYHFLAVRIFLHISRFCEDIIIYSSTEFGYVRLGDAVTTGSSIMPQKRNPDIAELLRGKCARTCGNLVALLTNLKGQPMAYNRDLQEDKVYLFDSIRQVKLGLRGLMEILHHIHFEPARVRENLARGFALATDLADFLVRERGLPFREAHAIAGAAVRYAEDNNLRLEDLAAKDWRQIAGFDLELPEGFFTPESSLRRRQGYGSTHPDAVAEQLAEARRELDRAKDYKP